MSVESTSYMQDLRPNCPDALNIHDEHLIDAQLRNMQILIETTSERKIDSLIDDVMGLKQAYDSRLTLAIINRRLDEQSISLLKKASDTISNGSNVIIKSFERAEPVTEEKNDALIQTAQRLIYLHSTDGTDALKKNCLVDSEETVIFAVPSKQSAILHEALALMPSTENVVGFKITKTDASIEVSLFLKKDERGVSSVSITLDEKTQKIAAEHKKGKKILIAIEGDIAGHSIRALETARGLRALGYEPDIFGSGYYAWQYKEEGFNCLPPFNTSETLERERIIAKARGEGEGVFFWNFKEVKSRVESAKSALRPYIQSGVDLLISDMNPIVDIAISQLQSETGVYFPRMTETHDIRLSPYRTLRTIKVRGIPVGEIAYRVNCLPVIAALDKNGRRHKITHFMLNNVADTFMGLPLFMYDRKRSGSKLRIKFTDYIYGEDGTMLFSLKQECPEPNIYPVGLQADKGAHNGSGHPEFPKGKAAILNAQGSTHNRAAWNITASALLEIPDSFSIHATGIKEDKTEAINGNAKTGTAGLKGYKVGYADNYYLAQAADVVINHGGFGTISQWLLAATKKIRGERRELDNLVSTNTPTQVGRYLRSCHGISRSLSVCNTFEQENNARSINEAGGENVCTVITADDLLKQPDPKSLIQQLIKRLLYAPIDNSERAFWLNLVNYESSMNAPAHIALILERIIVTQQKEHERS